MNFFGVKYSDIVPFLEKQNIRKLSLCYFSFDEYMNYVFDKKIIEQQNDETINHYFRSQALLKCKTPEEKIIKIMEY